MDIATRSRAIRLLGLPPTNIQAVRGAWSRSLGRSKRTIPRQTALEERSDAIEKRSHSLAGRRSNTSRAMLSVFISSAPISVATRLSNIVSVNFVALYKSQLPLTDAVRHAHHRVLYKAGDGRRYAWCYAVSHSAEWHKVAPPGEFIRPLSVYFTAVKITGEQWLALSAKRLACPIPMHLWVRKSSI